MNELMKFLAASVSHYAFIGIIVLAILAFALFTTPRGLPPIEREYNDLLRRIRGASTTAELYYIEEEVEDFEYRYRRQSAKADRKFKLLKAELHDRCLKLVRIKIVKPEEKVL